MAEGWFANTFSGMREWLIARAPELTHGLITTVPGWALGVLLLALLLGAIWLIAQFLKGGLRGRRAHRDGGKPVKGTFKPGSEVTAKNVEGLERQVAAQSELLAGMKARLDQLAAREVAAGAVPLDAEARRRRDIAAAEIVAESTPAANAAARELAAGDLAGAIATLERDARRDAAVAAEKWRRIGALVLGVDAAKVRTAYEEAFRLEPKHFLTCVEIARLRREAGDLKGVRQAALASESAAQNDRERSVAADLMGDVLKEGGDLAGAKARYETGLGINERLILENPGSASAQHALAASYNRLGDVLRESGDCEAARARYMAGLAIAEGLARDAPGSAQAQRDLAMVYERLGMAARDSGDLNGAKGWFERELRISKARMDADSASAEAKRFHSVVLNLLGDVLRTSGDLVGAKSRYEQSVEVFERLLRDSPGSAFTQRDLIVSYVKMQDVSQDPSYAQRALELALKLQKEGRLASSDTWMIEDLRRRAEGAPGASE